MVEDISAITEQEFDEFLSAKTDSERFKILLAHAEKNKKNIELSELQNTENCNMINVGKKAKRK